MKSINVSIIVCTINLNIVSRILNSIVGKVGENDEVILIVDGRKYLINEKSVKEIIKKNNWKLLINEENKGLSYSRNLGMKEMKNSFCIFFDDDTKITESVIDKYRERFSEGYDMVGGLLKLPEEYRTIPKWFPDGMSSLLGIHTFQYKIWGANFGFNAEFAKKHSIFFQQSLGRKGKRLQSGDDTTFVKQYCEKNENYIFDPEIVVYHYINEKRYRIGYMIRRAYWQGVSEVRRKSFLTGLRKELMRAKQIDFHNKLFVLSKILISILFIFVFLIGAFIQVLCNIFE